MEERIAIQIPAFDGSVVVQSHEASEDGEDIMRGNRPRYRICRLCLGKPKIDQKTVGMQLGPRVMHSYGQNEYTRVASRQGPCAS